MGSVPMHGIIQSGDESESEGKSRVSSAIRSGNVGGPILRQPEQKRERKKITIGKTKICVVRGIIADEQMDVIVNSAVKELKLNEGRASSALLRSAGQSIQKECDSKYKHGINHGEIAVTSGGNLSCKYIYHASLPKYENAGDEHAVKDIVITCLEQAERDKMVSIALPAFGTGFLGYPFVFVAMESFKAVEQFINTHPATTIQTISFVVYHRDRGTFKNFKMQARKRARAKVKCIAPRVSVSAVYGKTKVTVGVGDLIKEKVDVIVCNSGQYLKLSTPGLTKSLLKEAGDGLQVECNQMYKNGILPGDIAVTGGHNLRCKKIFHGYIPHWNSKQEVVANLLPEEILYNFVGDCIKNADTMGYTSIAFPAIGTGGLQYPNGITAGNMIKSIKDYLNETSSTKMIEVKIVLFSGVSGWQEIEQAFIKEIKGQPDSTYDAKLAKAVYKYIVVASTATDNSSDCISKLQGYDVSGRPMQSSPPRRGTKKFYRWMYKQEVFPPTYWTRFTSDKSIKDWHIQDNSASMNVIDIPLESITGRAITNAFQKCGMSYKSILKIQRIESLTLFEKYAYERQRLFRKAFVEGSFILVKDAYRSSGNPKTTEVLDQSISTHLYPEINEHYFFHGTKVKYVNAIVQQGLDNRLAATGNFGRGIYGAEKSSKSDAYVDRNINGESYMFLMRMCLGDIYTSTSPWPTLTRPPCRACGNAICVDHGELYDSVMAEVLNREFVVFDQNQVYPEYLIRYK